MAIFISPPWFVSVKVREARLRVSTQPNDATNVMHGDTHHGVLRNYFNYKKLL
jgi:hypothetical protein